MERPIADPKIIKDKLDSLTNSGFFDTRTTKTTKPRSSPIDLSLLVQDMIRKTLRVDKEGLIYFNRLEDGGYVVEVYTP